MKRDSSTNKTKNLRLKQRRSVFDPHLFVRWHVNRANDKRLFKQSWTAWSAESSLMLHQWFEETMKLQVWHCGRHHFWFWIHLSIPTYNHPLQPFAGSCGSGADPSMSPPWTGRQFIIQLIVVYWSPAHLLTCSLMRCSPESWRSLICFVFTDEGLRGFQEAELTTDKLGNNNTNNNNGCCHRPHFASDRVWRPPCNPLNTDFSFVCHPVRYFRP